MYRKISEDMLAFLDACPTSFHAVDAMRKTLLSEGFVYLNEKEKWTLKEGEGYFTIRNGSSLIAFTIPKGGISSFRIIASHSDSPTFKIKENPEICVENQFVMLNVEKYGRAILSSWLDRPLSVAGRVIVKEHNEFVQKLVNIDRDLLIIPNLAIHINRAINEGYPYNPQKDMLPIFGDITAKGTFMKNIGEAAGVREEEILGHDLYLYNRQKGTVLGAGKEFIASPRLDDLNCAYLSLQGFLQGKKEKHAALHCVFDNEEVGSSTRQGAASTFLKDTLLRIAQCMKMSQEDLQIAVAKSLMVSADNAHALHPAHTDKADPVNRPQLNKGIVIKFSADQSYCSDGMSAAMFRDICHRTGAACQIFHNRSDQRGGATLGNLSVLQMPFITVDIGLPSLAMHAPYEVAGIRDHEDFIKAASDLFE